MDTLSILLVVILAAVAVALGGWALQCKSRAQRLGRELAEAHEQVSRAQKLGSLGEMAASFAHSFNDVLTPIIGRTQLLAQRITDPQLREWLSTIERSALEGAQTVRRIQEFMRLRRDEPSVAVDLGVVARQAVASVESRRRGIEVRSELQAVPPVVGDPLGLREAMGNIILNALEAAPEGSTVVVAARMDGGDAVLSVADTGMGMTPGVQQRIFEPFFTTKPGATGLGLCLAHGIVSRHGGQIEVDSAPGRGTTVRVKFPVEHVSRAKAAPAAPRPSEAAAGPARCLVVDDDPQVRDMIRDILSNAGHRVVTAVDGSDGVEKFKADSSIDVVITDLAMPKLNGLQLARVCKTLRPSVPVVMLTGWGVLLTEDELAEHGVDEVLSKPVRMDQVLGTIASVRARLAGHHA
jgi:nitrogen-specific signal transduction histidine kinase/ActR/RegA family two-component response regulator